MDQQTDPTVREHLHDLADGEKQNGAATRAFPSLKMPCLLLKSTFTHKKNGTTYEVHFEVPIHNATPLAMMPDGVDVKFVTPEGEIIEVGRAGDLATGSMTRDPDRGWHLRIKLLFAMSEMGSLGSLGEIAKEDRVRGTLHLDATQGTFDLTARA
jgi:hypothetical protein